MFSQLLVIESEHITDIKEQSERHIPYLEFHRVTLAVCQRLLSDFVHSKISPEYFILIINPNHFERVIRCTAPESGDAIA